MERSRPSGSHARAAILRARAASLAEQLENEALKCSRVLALLDLKRARECTALAKRAHELAGRFERWSDPGNTNRLKDVLDYDDLLEVAKELGIDEVG